MRRSFGPAYLLVALALTGAVRAADDPRPGVDWPQFRGVRASGVADGFPVAIRWNGETGENVKWKTAIPGLAHSSPVIWRDLLCVTTAVSGKEDAVGVGIYVGIGSVEDATPQRWEVRCLDKRTGAARWTAVARSGVPAVKRHSKSTHANPTLATDGTHLVALFGSEGLFCYDLKGRLLWTKELGVLDSGYFEDPSAQWGFGGSPVISGQMVIVQADVQRGSFLAAFDIKTGREIWRTAREDLPTWSTPTVDVSGGRAQVIVNGYRHIGGYALETGKELWRMRGVGNIPVPTPVVSGGLAFITNAHGKGSPIFAVRTDATGDISLAGDASSNEYVAWRQKRGGSYIQTPLVYGDYLYVPEWNGVMGVYEVRTGQRVYRRRVGDGLFSASPVAAADKIYIASEEGSVFVVKAGPEFELLAENPMGEMCLATPAISEGVLFFRTRGHVVAIAEKR